MAMTDPVADMLTRIRNGIQARAKTVEIPASKLKIEVARILKSEGYIAGYHVAEAPGKPQAVLQIELKYSETGEPIDYAAARVARPGRRVVLKGPFATRDDVRRVIEKEESLLATPIRLQGDRYDTLLEKVNRSLRSLSQEG